MAIFHVATNTPPKIELIAPWLARQPWGEATTAIEKVDSFHLDDPDGEVGMQVLLVRAGDLLLQVPLTYRATPSPDADHAFIGEMEHSVLGTRYVYDGLGDDRFVTVLAGVASSGYGQSLGFAEQDQRWYAWPEGVRLQGFDALTGRLAVDRFELVSTDQAQAVFRNDNLELTVFRRLIDRPLPAIGVAATWSDQTTPITLATLHQHSGT